MRRRGLFLALALAGCVGPRPLAPKEAAVVPPPAWRTALGPGSAVPTDWWQGFGDPVLADLVRRALISNVDLATAVTRIEQARASERLARSQMMPQIDADMAGGRQRQLNAFGVPVTQNVGQPEVSASYVVDLFGRLRAADAAAKAQLLSSEAARDAVRLSIVSDVASGYITLRALDLRLTIAQDTLVSRAEALRIARRRATAGYTSDLELHQAEVEYRSTEQLVPAAKLAIARAEDALSVLLGVPPEAIPRGRPLYDLTLPPIPDGLPADLLRRRPDLFEAEQTLVAADRSLDSARAAMLPSIALTGSVGYVLSSLLPDPVRIWQVGGSVLQPIFDGGARRARADTAAAQRDQAAFAYRKAALEAFREVDDSLAGVLRSGEQADALAAQRDAAKAALGNASNRYRAGYTSYIEQLDAQRLLLSADLSLVQARADKLNAYVTLYEAMGGGWSPAEVAATVR